MESISFADLGLGELALSAVAAKGFESPTPIQVLAIPRLLNGNANVIAKARTGTGKTAAFGLPLVQTITERKATPQALILAPTRELALQVCKEIASFSAGGFPRLTPVYGGQSMREQLRTLKQGVEIVVGTPGRIKDHLDRGSLKLDNISYFILDEADEMLDMGFIDDIEFIFSKANAESRILLFSATMPSPILRIAGNFMGDYEIVEEKAQPETQLLTEQKFWCVREGEKIEALVRLIDVSPNFYGLVFTQTKADADAVSRQLDERGYDVAALHGDIPQNQREKILGRFRNKKTRILVATDVAARGIDIEGLTHVVNYALPFDGQTYVHRIGRTGRAGAKGLAFTLVRPEERRKFEFLRQAVRKAIQGEMQEADIPSIKDVLSVKRLRLFEELKNSIVIPNTENSIVVDTDIDDENEGLAITAMPTELTAVDPSFVHLANQLCDELDAKDVLARVLASTIGKHLDSDRYGHVSDYKMAGGRPQASGGRRSDGRSFGGSDFGGSRSGGRNERQGGFSGSTSGDQVRLYVSFGRRDGFNAHEVAEFFSGLLNIPQRLVDRIDVSSNFSLVSLPAQAGMDAIERSQRDRTLPHMHIDSKAEFGSSSGGSGRRNSRSSGERSFGGGGNGGSRGRSSSSRAPSHGHSSASGASIYKKAGAKRKDA